MGNREDVIGLCAYKASSIADTSDIPRNGEEKAGDASPSRSQKGSEGRTEHAFDPFSADASGLQVGLQAGLQVSGSRTPLPTPHGFGNISHAACLVTFQLSAFCANPPIQAQAGKSLFFEKGNYP
ncbi:hypothetical protein FRB93_008146 [Tulasnella sp. JGI-2019a]|nr:hypothetical protein FRB93_008146 [Tulasnella sp. JGI-2019a]